MESKELLNKKTIFAKQNEKLPSDILDIWQFRLRNFFEQQQKLKKKQFGIVSQAKLRELRDSIYE